MNISVDELITELSMTYSFRMHLLVEGNDDKKFFQSALNISGKVNIVCCWGSEMVTAIIKEIDKIKKSKGFLPTLGIIDRDYRLVLGEIYTSHNLLVSDLRDLECMMMASPAFRSVLNEFGSIEKIDAFGGVQAVADTIGNSAGHIGRLRFYSQKKKLSISFQHLDIEKIIDRKSLAIDRVELIKHLNARQGINGHNMPIDIWADIDNAYQTAVCTKQEPYFKNPLLLCRGHDLMELLAIAFRSTLGSRTAKQSNRESIELLFRLSYTAHFRNSQLAASIQGWLFSLNLHTLISIT